jgi:hypothetical protein
LRDFSSAAALPLALSVVDAPPFMQLSFPAARFGVYHGIG